MGEGDDPRFDEPTSRRHGQSVDPFWLDATARSDNGVPFERLGDLTARAAAAAKQAADEIRIELERLTAASGDSTDQESKEAEWLRSARERLTRFDREASGLARRFRQPQEPEPVEAAEPQESESVSPGARVLARQMAADGHSPEQIEARLAQEFGISGARAVVEQMLGSR
jgi:hypothetical protein